MTAPKPRAGVALLRMVGLFAVLVVVGVALTELGLFLLQLAGGKP